MFRPGQFDEEIYDWKFQDFAARNEGNGMTAIIDGKVMGCLFMTQPVEGLSEVWIYACDEVRTKHWLWLGMTFKSALEREKIPEKLGISRLRVRVVEGFEKSRQWIERLGFQGVSQSDGVIVYERDV